VRYWILGFALLSIPSLAASQRRSVPRGAFLARPAHTTRALLSQFDSNPEVRNRYIKIFGRSREESREILARLKPKQLTESHKFPVAYYGKSGKWLYQEKVLPKGTMVFVTPEGKPFLKEECGNPLVLSLPYPMGRGMVTKPPVRVPRSLEAPPISVVVTPAPAPELLFPPMEEQFGPISSVQSPDLLPTEGPEQFAFASPEGSPGILTPPGIRAGSDFPFWLALFLPFLFLGGGHGAPPGVVPEASTWVMIAAAGLGVLAASWRGRSGRSG
jgi:hypothetical protein